MARNILKGEKKVERLREIVPKIIIQIFAQ